MADNLNRMLRALFILALFLVSSLPRSPRANRPPAESWEPDSVPDAFSRPAAALMWPGATRAFLVEPDGCFYNGIWRVDVAATADGRRAAPPRRIAYEGRWRPIAHWTQRAGDVRWDFEAVALPAPEDAFAAWTRDISDGLALRADRGARAAWRRSLTADERDRVDRPSGASSRLARPAGEPVPLVVSVLATARNTGPLAAHATLDLALAPAGAAEPWYEDGPHRAPPSWGWCAPGVDSALGWCEQAAEGGASRAEARLAPGAAWSVHFVLASHPLPAGRLAGWARIAHPARAREARDWWAKEVSRGARFDLGDPEVEDAMRAARVVLLSCREHRGGYWVPLDGPFQSRDAWPREGARTIAALAAHGYTSEAHDLSESFFEWRTPQRPFGDGTADLATWAMRAGLHAGAETTLDALLARRNASGGACEPFTRGVNLPPQACSAAALLLLVRNSLVDDDGERLALTRAARPRWWRGARIDLAPTRWGRVSMAFERADGQAHWRWTRVPVWTELVLPPGTRLAAEPPAPLVRGPRADVVLAPPGASEARVDIVPAPLVRGAPAPAGAVASAVTTPAGWSRGKAKGPLAPKRPSPLPG